MPVPHPAADNVALVPTDGTLPLQTSGSPCIDVTAPSVQTADTGSATQQPSSSATPGTVQDPPTLAPGSQTWFPVDRLLKCKIQNGRRVYLVKWTGDNWPDSWEPEQNVTPALKQHFHTHFTYEGEKCKMRKKNAISDTHSN